MNKEHWITLLLKASVLQKTFSQLQIGFPWPTPFWDRMTACENRGKDNFITLHVGRRQVHCSQGPQAWMRLPAVFSCRHWRLLWPFDLSPPLQALHFSPLQYPHCRAERRWSSRCTARKHAAATLIALIARFFCWAKISGGARLQQHYQKPPKMAE